MPNPPGDSADPQADRKSLRADLGYTSRRLPEDLVNPDGVYSAIARRNAYEDGEFFPGAEHGHEIKTTGRRSQGRSNNDD